MYKVVFAVWMLLGCGLAFGQQSQYESFENGVPACYTASRAASLSVNPWHSKHGKSSLRWQWSKGEALVIRHGIGDASRAGGFLCKASFVAWLYVEEPIPGAVVFEFREGKKVTGSFRFPMRFTGWRQARVFYDEFPEGRPTSKVDNIRISTPPGAAKGVLYLDSVGYNALTYYSASIIPEKVAQRRRPVPDERRFPKPQHVTEAELAGIRKLGGALPEKTPGIPEARVKDLCGKVAALGIVRDEHGVRGPGLDGGSYYCSAVGEFGGKDVRHWPDELGPNGPMLPNPGPMISLAAEVGRAYRASNDAGQRRRLADAFLLIADHLQDQGQSLDAGGVLLMRDVLSQAGRLQHHVESVLYAQRAEEFFVEGDAPVRSNMDFYAYYARRLLGLCFLQADPAEQVRWLNAWKAMLERSILQPSGALKIDGSAYHHGGHYHSYAQGAFGNFPGVLKELHDTPWRLSPEAHERLRRAMLAQRLYANLYDLPVSLKGRSPFTPGYGLILPYGVKALETLALLGSPDGKEPVDREVAAAYLRLAPEAADKDSYRSLGIKPEPEPNGTFVMPYAALLAHRRNDWLACVKGQGKYVWGSERQAQRNCYGLFQGLGNLEILAGGNPVSEKASGCDGAGWDWGRFEGTTVPHLPLQDLDKGWPSISMTIRSPEPFVGGLSHQGRQGVFAMVLNQAIMPGNKTVKGKKSWFFSDDRILCLGSGISCDESRYATQTTLCQKSLRNDPQGEIRPTLVDGENLTAFPEKWALDRTRPHWFLDVQQTGYYLPAGQDITVARQHQTSRDVNDWEDTHGDFLTAWIDHGNAPTGADYEYMLVVRATPETMRKLAAEPPYHVLQRDDSAHIVWDAAGRRWGCVFFLPQENTSHTVAKETLPIKAVDRPCLAMAHSAGEEQLDLSAADPDLNLEDQASKPRPLRITLRGKWRLVEAKGTVCVWPLPDTKEKVRIVSASAAETVVEIVCQHGASYDLKLGRLAESLLAPPVTAETRRPRKSLD